MVRSLTVLALAVAAAAPAFAQPPAAVADLQNPYPLYERRLSPGFYSRAYRLTPADYHRFRAMGLSREEVFMIANAAAHTGIDPSYFAHSVFRGRYARWISTEFGVTRRQLTRVLPEWRTPEWAAATGDSPYTRSRLRVWF
jgi:hypothetical protein